MGLWRGKVQSIFMGFYILPRADDKEASTYQEKRYVQKKKRKETKTIGKYLSRSIAYLVLDSGAYVVKKRQESLSAKSYRKISQKTVYVTCMFIFLSLYPKKFGYSLEGYSHRSTVAHPIERSRQKKGRNLEPIIKNELLDKWFRCNRLHFLNNKL
jgi:hypothetical protein